MSAWILLRGLARESRHWAHLPAILRARGIDGEIVFADLPGSGRHIRERAPTTIAATTDFVRARSAAGGSGPPYRIIGMSLGAMVAVDWARRFPDDVEALVLINTSMRRHAGTFERLRPGAWARIARAAWGWNARMGAETGPGFGAGVHSGLASTRTSEAIIHALTCARTDTRAGDLAAWTAVFESAPPTRRNALRQLWAAARFHGPPLAPRCPTLLLASRADALVHPVCSKKLAAAWNAPLVEHPWAGHDLAHDDPAWLADTIAAWVGNASAVAAPPTSA